MKKFYSDPKLGIQTEDVPTNNASSGAVDLSPDAQMKKKKKNPYDGRTREAKQFYKRMAERKAKREAKQNLQNRYKRILWNVHHILLKIT